MINITETFTTMLGVEKDFDEMTKDDFYRLLKAKERRIQKLKGRLRESNNLISYKEEQRISLVSDLGKVEARNQELVNELHQLKLDYGVYDKEREERIKYFS